MQTERKPRRPRKKKEFIGEKSFDARAGRIGLNLLINVPRDELKAKMVAAGYRQINILIGNIALAPFQERGMKEEEGTVFVHTKIPIEVWLQWMKRVPRGISPRDAMGKMLSYWCSRQPSVPIQDYAWADPWDETEVLEREEEESGEESEESEE